MSLYPAFQRPTTFGMLPDGVPGIRQTLKIMCKLQREWRKDPGIRELAARLVRNLPQGDKSGSVRQLHAFVRDHIRYTNDIEGVETIQTPRATLELEIGDCDDKSVLLGSLLGAIGLKVRFVALGFGPVENYSHVLPQVRLGRGWYYLETIKPVPAGWSPDNVKWRLEAHSTR